MIRPKPGKPTIDPRQYLAEFGPAALQRLIASTGYVPQQRPFRAFVKALKSGSALLTEGLGGSGKTAFAEAVVEACNLPFFSIPCMPKMPEEVLLGKFNTEAQNAAVRKLIEKGISPQRASRSVWTVDFFELGEALGAYAYLSRSGITPLLLLDEIDKLEPEKQFTLLQLLARNYADIPKLQPENRLGVVSGKPPIVYLTSNNMASGVNTLFRSRALYAKFEEPTLAETIAIFHARVPAAPISLFTEFVKLVHQYRHESCFILKPELRDWIRLLAHLVEEDVCRITFEVLDECATFMAKEGDDWTNYFKKLNRFLEVIEAPDQRIQDLVNKEFYRTEPNPNLYQVEAA